MDTLPRQSIFEFNANTLEYLRKQYDLDTPGRIEDAIDALEQWVKKQQHFVKKEFPRDYLERTIILSKGSVERAKSKLDNICTFRTMFPDFFGIHDIKNFKLLKNLWGGFLPKLTDDHYRVYAFNFAPKPIENGLLEYHKYFFMQCEYIQAYDYCNGLVLFLDYRENVMEIIKAISLVDARDTLRIMKEGYGMRIKGIHIVTKSKMINIIMAIAKQVLSAKLLGRIYTHTCVETVYQYIPKDILPIEYGGKEKPLIELHNQYLEVLSSKPFTDYLQELNEACTNEKLRQTDNSGAQHMGVAGTFRALSID